MPSKKKSSQSADNTSYDEPDVPESADQDEDEVQILEPPDDEALAAGLDEDPVDSESEVAASHLDATVMEAKAEIESVLAAKTSQAVSAMGAIDVDGGDMIQGVGVGSPEVDMDQIGPDGPGSMVLNVYTAEKLGQEDVRRCLCDDYCVECVKDDSMPLNVFETGIIDSQPHRHKERPSPCGISVGHFRITAGTQGALATGRSAPRSRRVLMLSNNHVLANSNQANFGDNILQPGRADGGQNPRDRIGILERFVRIDFAGGVNFVDCATAWCWSDRVRKEFIYRSGGAFRYFRVSSQPTAARRGMIVGKTGRTTQLRTGRITGTSETVRVNFNGRLGLFRDQVAIRGLAGDFSQGGDSGSLIWTWDRSRRPVALLFAGGGGMTFGNKIGRVLAALDIRMVT